MHFIASTYVVMLFLLRHLAIFNSNRTHHNQIIDATIAFWMNKWQVFKKKCLNLLAINSLPSLQHLIINTTYILNVWSLNEMATLLYSHCLKTRGKLHPGLGRPGSQIKSFILMQLTHYAQSWVRDFSETLPQKWCENWH